MLNDDCVPWQRGKLIDFGRAVVNRTHTADPFSHFESEEALYISVRDDPRAVIKLLTSHRRFFEDVQCQLTDKLNAVLMIVERLETELTTLRGEVQGLRSERREFLDRLRRTERSLEVGAEEFSRQITDEVARLADKFTCYVNDVNQIETNTLDSKGETNIVQHDIVPTGPSRPAAAKAEEQQAAVGSPRSRAPWFIRLFFDGGIGQSTQAETVSTTKTSISQSFIERADRARDARDWRMAAQCYRKALEEQPNNAPIWVQYGHASKEAGNKKDAEDAYQKSIELDPNVADTHLQLGHVLKVQGKSGAAAAAYLHALSIDPAFQDATKELVSLGWTRNRIKRALQQESPE